MNKHIKDMLKSSNAVANASDEMLAAAFALYLSVVVNKLANDDELAAKIMILMDDTRDKIYKIAKEHFDGPDFKTQYSSEPLGFAPIANFLTIYTMRAYTEQGGNAVSSAYPPRARKILFDMLNECMKEYMADIKDM